MREHANKLLADAGPHLAMLEITSDPALVSGVETLGDTTADRSAAQAHLARASKNEEEFNRVLSEYSAAYREFSEHSLKGAHRPHRNTVLDTGKGDYVYVNDHGATHKYSVDSWEKRHSSCSQTVQTVDPQVIHSMPKGADMQPGQPCGVSGKNIENEESGRKAWVDTHGIKHEYSDTVWRSKDRSCQTDVKSLSSQEYNAIPSGPPMIAGKECSQGTIDKRVWNRLQKLNKRLIFLAQEISKDLAAIKTNDSGTQKQLDMHQSNLNAHVATLRKDHPGHSTAAAVDELENARGISQSTRLLATSRWYHYWVWIVTAIIVVLLTSRALSTNDPGAATTLIALVALLVILYNVIRWLYDKLVR